MTVKEASPEELERRASRRRIISFTVLAVCITAGLSLWFIYLPWLLRSKVEDALRSGGVRGVSFRVERATPWGSELSNVAAEDGKSLGIRRVVLDYSPVDLWDGKLDAIHIVGGRIELNVREGKVDFSSLTRLISRTQAQPAPSSTQPAKLPVSRIDLTDSSLVINTEKQVLTVPIDVTVVGGNGGKVVVDARLGPNRNLIIGGMVDLAAKSATFEGAASAGWTLLTVRSIWPGADVGVDGFLQLAGDAHWSTGTPNGVLRVAIAPPSATQPSQAAGKLQVQSGVFLVTANFGAQPHVSVDVRDANFTATEAGMAGEGVAGELVFNQFSPLATPPDQKFVAKKLTVGQLNLSDGQVWLQMPASDTINIRETRWKWLGGQLFSQGIRIRGQEPVQMTLQLRDVELKGLLELLAKDKASGDGKLTGTLPVTIKGSNVEFGDARISALSGGAVQIKDAAAILPTAEAAARTAKDPTAAEQIKHNIVEALSDFVFERLSAQLVNEDGRLIGYVRMSGRGRSGAKQPIDYELRVSGLDGLLRSYVSLKTALSNAQNPSTRKATP